ncbi:hypothetical protein KIK84_14750 [Curvibacter sp. CHRR-16]|uniref:hypothetical protein n=1 Tax=Curvibacter sp. CHRR-16 TaxID=2835872 RepID=UPI001BDADF3B|nr:hypothetical protein [Curvibacter sp. CHRR-16]MBT0571584.1 hypothetical protein [Curvibacter sp. CHRR-16]
MTVLLLCAVVQSAGAGELFAKEGANDAVKTFLQPGDVAGGRAIYQGGRKWFVASSQVKTNNMDVGIGNAVLTTSINGRYFATQYVTASINSVETNGYYTYNVCSSVDPTIIYKVKKSMGVFDNCVLVRPITQDDSQKSDAAVGTMRLDILNTREGNRFYSVIMVINLMQLGLEGGACPSGLHQPSIQILKSNAL